MFGRKTTPQAETAPIAAAETHPEGGGQERS